MQTNSDTNEYTKVTVNLCKISNNICQYHRKSGSHWATELEDLNLYGSLAGTIEDISPNDMLLNLSILLSVGFKHCKDVP